MSTIRVPKGNDNFTPLAEGTYVFKVESVEYDTTFKKLKVVSVNKQGRKVFEDWMFERNGQAVEGAYKSFGFFAHTCLQNFEIEDIDPNDLVGKFFKGTVEHQIVDSKNNPGEKMTFVKIVKREKANAFEGEATVIDKGDFEEISVEDETEEMSDLDNLLNNL